MPNSAKHQHVIALEAENFKRLVAVALKFSRSGVQEIKGQNAQGKSSVLDAIQAAIGGKAFSPEDPIRRGQSEARIVVETEDLRVTRRYVEEETYLSIEPKSGGATFKKPQQMLDQLMGVSGSLGFEPFEFVRMKEKDQAAMLRSLTGLDTSDLDGERERIYAERTVLNRDVETLRGKIKDEALPEEVPAPEPIVDVAPLLAQLEEAHKRKGKNDKARTLLKELQRERSELEQEIQEIRTKLAGLEADRESLLKRLLAGQAVVDALADPDTADLQAKIADAGKHNAEIMEQAERKRQADSRADRLRDLDVQLREKETVAAHQSSRIKEIDEEKRKRTEAAKMPIPGLGLEDGVVTLAGVPLKQASQSQQIRTGLAIAASLNPQLRCLLVRDGSLLDDKSKAELAAWAEEADMQVFLEVVGSGPGGITIHEGRVTK